MIHAIENLIREYGTVAVFLGCLAEGEGAAIVGGFFAHQHLLPPLGAFIAAGCGTGLANTLLFFVGRNLAATAFVRRMRAKPGFSHALELAEGRPRAFVFFNRFVYGMRLIAGTAAGIAEIPMPLFLIWNAVSAVVWAAVFVSIGYFFGLGAEVVLGRVVQKHQRVIIGAGILILASVIALIIARRVRRREARLEQDSPPHS